MTLSETKTLLGENGIESEEIGFENEAKFMKAVITFPYTSDARDCKVKALMIRCNNGKKDITLEFIEDGDEFVFEDMMFGEYSYEMYDYEDTEPENDLQDELIAQIKDVLNGKVVCIVVNDLKKKKWRYDALFSHAEICDDFDHQKVIRRLEKEKSLFAKLFKTEKQYEVYDMDTYKCVIK